MDNELIDYCIENNFSYRILSDEEKAHICNIIESLYQKTKKFEVSLFDTLDYSKMVCLPRDEMCESWKCIYSFIENKRIIVFFHYYAKNEKYIELLKGNRIVDYLTNTSWREFYILDPNGNFLLGYNRLLRKLK